jgi:hypothetical protein
LQGRAASIRRSACGDEQFPAGSTAIVKQDDRAEKRDDEQFRSEHLLPFLLVIGFHGGLQ